MIISAMPMLKNEIDELYARLLMVQFMLSVSYGNIFAQMPEEISARVRGELVEKMGDGTPAARQWMLDNKRYKEIADRSVELSKEFIAAVTECETAVRALDAGPS